MGATTANPKRRDPAPPYGTIWMELRQGRVVPFLGAGASLGTGVSPPSGRRLAEILAALGNFPSEDPSERGELAKVASYYEESHDRQGLREVLRGLFARDYPVRPVHLWLARLRPPPLIITTNYDDLIERAFEEAGEPYHLVVHPTDREDLMASVLWWEPGASKPRAEIPGKLPLRLNDTAIIYKIHGSIDRSRSWDSFVISEDDYVDFLARMTHDVAVPSHFALHLQQSHFLFLGYGLADWNLRLLLRSLPAVPRPRDFGSERKRGKQPDPVPGRGQARRSWAINLNPSVLEQELWDTRRVNIYDLSVDEFVCQLDRWIEDPANQSILASMLGGP